MSDDLPVPAGPLPTLSDWLAGWLGFQLPVIPMPQTVKNIDKAVGKILLAAGENAEARIKANTGRAKAKGKIEVEGLYRTEEDRRKLENRAAIVKVAVDEINEGRAGIENADAKTEIDDDWLNMFARFAEDKSSEELKGLFGRILAGEIRNPGAFSLRTIQFLSTLSKSDAHDVSKFLSYALSGQFVPLFEPATVGPHIHDRIKMQELGLATHASIIGGLAWSIEVVPGQNLLFNGTGLGILVENQSTHSVAFQLECQVLTKPSQELMQIANPPATPIEYLKAVAQVVFEKIRAEHADDLAAGKMALRGKRWVNETA
jgi:hypothetical protein